MTKLIFDFRNFSSVPKNTTKYEYVRNNMI